MITQPPPPPPEFKRGKGQGLTSCVLYTAQLGKGAGLCQPVQLKVAGPHGADGAAREGAGLAVQRALRSRKRERVSQCNALSPIQLGKEPASMHGAAGKGGGTSLHGTCGKGRPGPRCTMHTSQHGVGRGRGLAAAMWLRGCCAAQAVGGCLWGTKPSLDLFGGLEFPSPPVPDAPGFYHRILPPK